jgi:hypothetical protein
MSMLGDFKKIVAKIDRHENVTVKELRKLYLRSAEKILVALSALYEKSGKDKLAYADVSRSRDLKNLYDLVKVEAQKLGDSTANKVDKMLDEGSAMSYEWMHAAILKDVAEVMKDKTPHLPELLATQRKGFIKSIKKDQAIKRTQTAFDHDVRTAIRRSFVKSEGYVGVAKEIRRRVDISAGRAETIARTEMHRVREKTWAAHASQVSSIGLPMTKTWRTAGDGRVRHTSVANHVVMDGQERDVDKNYNVNGHPADAPGNTGIAAEDVRCRCISVYQIVRS